MSKLLQWDLEVFFHHVLVGKMLQNKDFYP